MTRPHVVAHNLASLDGRVTTAPGVLLLHGDARWEAAVAGGGDAYAKLRRAVDPDAFLEGSGSFVREGDAPFHHPEPPPGERENLYADFLPDEVVHRAGHRGWFTVVDGRGRIEWRYKEYPDPEWAGWHVLVLTCSAAPPGYLAYLRRERIPYLVTVGERVDLVSALDGLYEKLGVRRVLSTAGGHLHGALLRAGLVDEIDLELAPAIIGGDRTPSLFGGPPLGIGDWPTRVEVTSAALEAGRVVIRCRVLGPVTPPDPAEAGAG
jgi:riboflavin biosynthesis pyrimidine reductase